MKKRTRMHRRWFGGRGNRNVIAGLGLGGGGLTLAGCAVLGGGLAAVAIFGLTGLFLGSIQASFAATARSYGFTDTGNVQTLFNQPGRGGTNLVGFAGRLPGFHVVIVSDRSKAVLRSQADAIVYETDVQIDFEKSPPEITGRVRERGGGEQFDLHEVYPDIEVSPPVVVERGEGSYSYSIHVAGHGPDGEQLDYVLTADARLTQSGAFMYGDVQIKRTFTAPEIEALELEGDGELSAVKDEESAEITSPIEDETEDEVDDGTDEPADNDGDSEDEPGEGDGDGGDVADDPDDSGDDPAGDDGGSDDSPVDGDADDDEPADDGDPPTDDSDDDPDSDGDAADEPDDADAGAPPLVEPASACLPGLPELLAGAVDLFIEAGGKEALDLNGSGIVGPPEVQEAINPLIAPFFVVSPEAALCIAELMNE